MKQESLPLGHTGLTVASGFPTTRYLGSKRKLLRFLYDVFNRLSFDTALDPFSGTGAVAYLLKAMGKSVVASDLLACNVIAARALVENNTVRLGNTTQALLEGIPRAGATPGFIEKTFEGIFFETAENRFLDEVLPRILALPGYERDLAYCALFQSCLAKRPYNLFHRANLSMRRGDVARTFGNKTTWERPFPEHMMHFSKEIDDAVFETKHPCKAVQGDVAHVDPTGFDLVYLDPPYISKKGVGVDYLDYYHFLEGLADPVSWSDKIVYRYKHLPLAAKGASPWSDPARIEKAFADILALFHESKMVISYRSDGIPSIDQLVAMLQKMGKRVEVADVGKYTYALSQNRASREVVLIAH